MAKRGPRASKKNRDAKTSDDMKAAAAGENPRLNLPSPRDLKHHYATILGFKDKVDEATGRLRNAYKQAEEAGIDCAAIRFAMTKAKKDPLVLKVFLAQVAEHFKELGMPFQISLFETINGTPEEQAYKMGFEVGEAGKTPENPYPDGSAPNKEYARGVAHGIGKNLGQSPEQVDAALAADHPTEAKLWPDDEEISEGALQ